MESYDNLVVSPYIFAKINQFYNNMSMKRRDSYGTEEIVKLVNAHYDATYGIGKLNYQAEPLIRNWKGAKRILIDEWNYAVHQIDDFFYVLDACHYLNLHEKNPTVLDLDILPFRPTNITLAGRDSSRFIRCLINGNTNQSIMKKLNQKDLKNLMENKCDLEYLANKYFSKDILSYCEQSLKIKR